MSWMKFFLGTPKRFMYTAIAIAVLVAMDKMGYTKPVFESIFSLINPFIGEAALLGMIFIAFRIILSGGRRKK